MNNKENLQYFESKSMKGLYETMKDWQVKNKKRLLSTDIQQDGHLFTCIALTNPTEVVLCDELGNNLALYFVDATTQALRVVTEPY
tara:strand:- start:51 stop:308 length:258 start_codon:yes stop_codon:yes gene_type:complete